MDYTSDTRAPEVSSDINITSLTSGQFQQVEIPFPCSQQRVIQVPLRGVNQDSLSNAHDSAILPVFCTQWSRPQLQSPNSARNQDPAFQVYPYDAQTRSSPQLCNVMDKNIHKASSDQMEHKQGHKLDLSEEGGHFSSATDRSGSSSFCNSTLKRFNSINSRDIGNVNLVPNMKFGPESGNEATLMQEGSCHRSMLREAALIKFRMKRKDRCFEKKVYIP